MSWHLGWPIGLAGDKAFASENPVQLHRRTRIQQGLK
jgi:hypothetical protein